MLCASKEEERVPENRDSQESFEIMSDDSASNEEAGVNY